MKFKGLPITTWDIFDPESPEKNIGHTIRIPNRCMDEMLYTYHGEDPIYIEVVAMEDTPNARCHCLVFGNIEPGEEEIVVVPFWALDKLGVESFGQVSIENVQNIRKVGYIRVRANNSEYVYWDGLKETLEAEFSKILALSTGDLINILGVEFYITELRDLEGIRMLDGSLHNTDVKIDFDTPSDIEELERRQAAEIERIAEINRKRNEQAQQILEEAKRALEEARFPGSGQTASNETTEVKELTREERARIYEERLKRLQSSPDTSNNS